MPTQFQKSAMTALLDRGIQSQGAFLSEKMTDALEQACVQFSTPDRTMGLGDAIDTMSGFEFEQRVATANGAPLVPDIDSPDPFLCFIALAYQIYGTL